MVPPPDTIAWGGRASTHEFGGTQTLCLLHHINDIILESLVMLGIHFAFFLTSEHKNQMFPLADFCYVLIIYSPSLENKHSYLKIFSKVTCPPELSVELRLSKEKNLFMCSQ